MLEWLFGKKKEEPQNKPKKTQKQKQDQDKWMYDFMIQFLMSPLWQITILDFVDSKCVVFDNEEENKFEYTIIHNEFKEIVGNLVDGMMEQVGMDHQKLAELIQKGLESKQKKIFNQLLLADDFMRFKDLMLKRNKILQQQAIKALKESQIRSSQVQEKKMSRNSGYEAQLLRQSKRMEEERQRKLQEQEEEMLRKAIEMSKIDSKQHEAIKALEEKAIDKVQDKPVQKVPQVVEQKQVPKVKGSSRLEPLRGSNNGKGSQLGDLPPLRGSTRPVPKAQEQVLPPVPVQQKVQQVKQQVVKESIEQSKPVQQQSQGQSLEDRKKRLMQQREKIRKQKQEQRRKQLQQQGQQQKQSQPVVQTIVLQEQGFMQDTSVKKEVVKAEHTGVSEEELRRRKELMNKIKNRIIDDF